MPKPRQKRAAKTRSAKTRDAARTEEKRGTRGTPDGITADEVIAELAKIARANVMDFMRITDEGDPLADFSKIDRECAAAICEVTVEDFRDGRGENARDVRRLKFKLYSKLEALDKLARHFGLFKERTRDEAPDGTALAEEADSRQLARAVLAILRKSVETGETE